LENAVGDAETVCSRVYERHIPLFRFMDRVGLKPPAALKALEELVLNIDLRRQITQAELDPDGVEKVMGDIRQAGVALDEALLARLMTQTLEQRVGTWMHA